MRTIKFRVWDNVDYMSPPFTIQDIQKGNIQMTSDLPVMQFTGLTDKNGKEIYEGDILKVYKPNTWLKFDDFHVVKYHETQAKFAYWCVRIRDWTTSNTGLFNIGENQHGRWCEVIGNIYENPNLLK